MLTVGSLIVEYPIFNLFNSFIGAGVWNLKKNLFMSGNAGVIRWVKVRKFSVQ